MYCLRTAGTPRLFSEKRDQEESWMTKAEQVRLARWRMKVLRHVAETTHNVSQTCRYFGISRKTFYKWKHATKNTGKRVWLPHDVER
jgi:ActR/RegA family two-component response regulator